MTKMTRILLFVYNSDSIGGPTTSMRLIKNSFLNQKYDFFEMSISKRPRYIVLNPFYTIGLIRKIRKIDPDIIHFSGLQFHGFYVALLSKLAGYKNTLMAVRGSASQSVSYPAFFKMIYSRIIEPVTVRLTGVTYTVCKPMAENYIIKRHCKHFGGIIHNSAPEIDPDRYDRQLFRNEIKVLPDDLLFVYTGRICEEKGLSFAVEAFIKLNRKDLKLVLVGDGPDFRVLEQKYSSAIESGILIMTGKRSDVMSVLAGCDVFIFPTLHENLSNSLLEAGSMGICAIATEVGGNPEVVRNGLDGILIAPFSSEAVYDAVAKLEKERCLIKKMSISFHNRIKTEFSQRELLKKIDLLYAGFIKTKEKN